MMTNKLRSVVILACLLFTGSITHAQKNTSASRLRWISSTEAEPWKQMVIETTPPPAASASVPIRLDDKTVYQQIDGFGSCFNEYGWDALMSLDKAAREQVLKSLFSPEDANFTLGRMPIGANDFANGYYSFDDTPGDFTLKNFSIDRDRKSLLPFIHAAMKYQPNLGVWAVPWSPPSWLTTNGDYKHGRMKQDPQSLATYALYFSKFVQAYRNEGVHLYAVMPQNEPKYNNNVYPQAAWSGAELNTFLRDYLAPRLKQDHIDIQVWEGTIVNENLADFILPVLDDPVTNPIITGVAYQYKGQLAMRETHDRYPDKKLMQSETECYNGENQWQQGLVTYRKIIQDTSNFAGSYFYWNTVLNEVGRSHWDWHQNSLLIVDRTTKQVHYNPEFYSMKHFSAKVLPGARRIAVSGGPFADIIAFKNPSGDNVVEFLNDSDATIAAAIQADGNVYQLRVPAKSMNTLTISSTR